MRDVKKVSKDPKIAFSALARERQAHVLKWIWENLEYTKSINGRSCAYNLKHQYDASFEEDRYLTECEFAGALMAAGFRHKAELIGVSRIAYSFNISQRSILAASKRRSKLQEARRALANWEART